RGILAAMEILERSNVDGVPRHRANSLCSGGGGRKSGDARYVVADGCTTNRFFVVEGFAAQRRVNHQIHFGGLDQVDDIRPTLIDFEDGFDFNSDRCQWGSGSARA